MAANLTTQQTVRRFLNPAIKGRFADALVAAIASGDDSNATLALAVKDQLFVATATGQYLETLFSQFGVVKPPQTGIDDDTFRNLGVAITNNKLVTNVFLQVLEAFYGLDAVAANVLSTTFQPFNLADGMQLSFLMDNNKAPLTVTFSPSDFESIDAATAQEVADSISRQAFDQGYTLTAAPYTDNVSGNTFLQLFSGTLGPKGSIEVVGGQAQNVFLFPTVDPTTQMAGTQFTMSISGGNVQFTWTSGPDPSLSAVQVGDYVNIFGSGFSPTNQGTYTIVEVQGGTIGNSYFQVQNPSFVPQAPVTIGAATDIQWFHPTRTTIVSLTRKASVYEINPYEIVVLLPVTTKIVKRTLIGSAHINPSVAGSLFLGSYIYDTKAGFNVSSKRTTLTQEIDAGQVYTVVDVQSSQSFPNQTGYLVFEYGYQNQEGPVKYLFVSSENTLYLDPSYKFKHDHAPNITVNYVSNPAPIVLPTDGSAYQFYLTDSVNGRVQAESLIDQLAAAGVTVTVVVVYPDGPGLVNVEADYSESD
jgi:hypothetical protein